MITFFSVPKSFKGHIAIIQENAIKSWLKLIPKCEIIIYGDEEGIKEICDKYDLVHVPIIKKNEYGTPTLDYIFKNVQTIAKNNILCYVNTDIILLNDIVTTIHRIPFKNFLIVGQRRDVDIFNNINYEDMRWENDLKEYVIKNFKPLNGGIDYLIFSKGIFNNLPPFAVGRAGWDNWMVYNSRKLNIPTIDATQSILAIHQNHSYSHVPQRSNSTYGGPESENNVKIGGGRKIYFWNLDDTDWTFNHNQLMKKNLNFQLIYRKLIIMSPEIFHPFLELIFYLQHVFRYKILKKD
jgi:hypothetical protein